MDAYLLQRDVKYGPLFCKWYIMVLQWIYKDSESGPHMLCAATMHQMVVNYTGSSGIQQAVQFVNVVLEP